MVDEPCGNRKEARHYAKAYHTHRGRPVRGHPDPEGEKIEELDPSEIPPAITHEASFRCADNSLVYVEFYQNDRQVRVATEKDAIEKTTLKNEAIAAAAKAEEAGEEPPEAPVQPRYSGEGYVLVGASDAPSVQFARDDGELQRCKS